MPVAGGKRPDGDAPLSTSFGHVIKSRRRLLDLTQQELASQVGYSVITIRKVEADESGLARIEDKTGVIHAGIMRKARS